MADWNAMPEDILLVISKKITNISDLYRFSCVSRSWRTVALEYGTTYVPFAVPCLMVPDINYDITCKSRRLLTFPVDPAVMINKEERDRLPQIILPHRALCCGSYGGWLVMIEESKEMYLLNPFSEKRIDLPPAMYQKGVYFGKVILSTIPNNNADCFAMISYSFGKLDFCKVGDKSWRSIDISILSPRPRHKAILTDAIFFKGKFYLVSIHGEIYACDPNAPEPILTRQYEKQNLNLNRFWHLMESEGEIFGIMHDFCHKSDEERVKHIESLSSEGRENIYNILHEFHRCRHPCKTCSFEVYKLYTRSGSSARFIKVDNLDGKAAFLGRNHSFTISNPSVFGYRGNRIYFSDDRYRSYGMNVFNMEDGVFEPLYITNYQLPKAPPIWVTPQP